MFSKKDVMQITLSKKIKGNLFPLDHLVTSDTPSNLAVDFTS
mgnify:FL=1